MAPRVPNRLPVRRQAELLSYLRRRGSATITELAEAVNTSESTVRRDLDQLAQEGQLKRTHGGASITEHRTSEIRFVDRRLEQVEEKARIGQRALSLLEPGQSVIFDSSTTVLAVVDALAHNPMSLTAVTHDLHIAATLASIPKINVIVPGGEVRPDSFTLLGPTTLTFLQKLHVDVAVLGIHAITGTTLTEGGLVVAETKGVLMRAATRTLLLADSSKFTRPAFYDAGDMRAVHDFITDNGAPEKALEVLRESTETHLHVV